MPRARPSERVRPTNAFVPFGKEWLDRSMADRFEHIVALYPQRPAILDRGRAISYEELNQSANQIAHLILEARGDKPEPVALLLGHGPLVISAMLAVLKVGKFYVALDPSSPRERAWGMLRDLQARLLLTDREHWAQALAFRVEPCLPLNIEDRRNALPDQDPGISVPADRLAYLLYTSGSSGQPKGVLHSQRTFLHEICVQTGSQHLSAEDHFSLLTSTSYGFSMSAVYGSLLNGGALCPYDLMSGGLQGAVQWMRDQAITVYHSTPTFFRRLAAEGQRAAFSSLRLLKIGGETVLPGDVELFRSLCPTSTLLRVGYATTETNGITEILFDHTCEVAGPRVPVGHVHEDISVMLWDGAGRPVGEQESGEIVVKSRYLSPGYWARPELTEAAFLRDPLGSGERLYRTGDLGRFDSDGCLFHLGRMDTQVKVRGYRVELSEVERALSDVSGARQVLVVNQMRKGGEQVLVGYLVQGTLPAPSSAALRQALREKLPSHMVPSSFVWIESLPLTPSGKVDRKALPPLARAGTRRADRQAPRTALEKQLCRIWEETLKVRPVALEDDFFDLGGTSLQALQLFERIERRLGKRIPLAVILQASTVRQQVELLTIGPRQEMEVGLIPLQPNGGRVPLFLVHPLGGHVLSYHDLASYFAPDQPVLGLESAHVEGLQPLPSSIEEIAADSLRQVRGRQPHGPYILGGHSFGGVVAFEMAQQLLAQGEPVALLVLLDTGCPGRKIERLPLRERLDLRMAELKSQSLSGKIALISRWGAGRIQNPFRRLLRGGRAGLRGDVYAYYRKVGESLPVHLRELERAHLAAFQRYRPRPYTGRAFLVRAEERAKGPYPGASLGWDKWMKGRFEIVPVPGDHASMLEEPRVKQVAEAVAKKLSECWDSR